MRMHAERSAIGVELHHERLDDRQYVRMSQ